MRDENNLIDRKPCSETSGAASIRLPNRTQTFHTWEKSEESRMHHRDASSACHCRRQESVIPVTLTRYRRFSHGLKRLLSATLRALEDAMGGFRCRLGWCLSPGAVFKTAAPYSGFLMVVVVSVMLVCGLRLPGLLASWLRRSGSGPACVVRSRAFWTGFRGEWYDRRRFFGGFVSGSLVASLLSRR
jgi:hypothetical protein